MSDDETYEIPLQHQRVFGAGIKRKRVKFVPSISSSSNAPPRSSTPSKSISARYLNLVLPKDAVYTEESAQTTPISTPPPTVLADTSTTIESQICEICNLPLSSASDAVATSKDEDDDLPSAVPNTRPPLKPRPHEASLAHQVCLAHSHPPSHLDRTRKGLTYLSSYGWDPDSRLGLGSQGQGIAFPIKAKPKDDKLGIGVTVPKALEKRKQKVEKLDAGRVRKAYDNDKKKGERLREMFYMSEDVEKYLRG